MLQLKKIKKFVKLFLNFVYYLINLRYFLLVKLIETKVKIKSVFYI